MELVSPPLFERLPAEIFKPLAAPNNRRYWALLCRLLDELWGDGARTPGEEAPKAVVIRSIESLKPSFYAKASNNLQMAFDP